ncbi:hypothetical protein M758_4G063200 [Ceratodon purpureus]|nr:hypothetical protein M758_4G063200 [Ceratodon purpureus]
MNHSPGSFQSNSAVRTLQRGLRNYQLRVLRSPTNHQHHHQHIHTTPTYTSLPSPSPSPSPLPSPLHRTPLRCHAPRPAEVSAPSLQTLPYPPIQTFSSVSPSLPLPHSPGPFNCISIYFTRSPSPAWMGAFHLENHTQFTLHLRYVYCNGVGVCAVSALALALVAYLQLVWRQALSRYIQFLHPGVVQLAIWAFLSVGVFVDFSGVVWVIRICGVFFFVILQRFSPLQVVIWVFRRVFPLRISVHGLCFGETFFYFVFWHNFEGLVQNVSVLRGSCLISGSW